MIAVEDPTGGVVGYAIAHPYADRCCYGGIDEFSVYVCRSEHGRGAGRAAMTGLVDDACEPALRKLLSQIFPENRARLSPQRATPAPS